VGKFYRVTLHLLALVAVCSLSSRAHAALYLFNLTGPNTASFTLDSSPTPASTTFDSFQLQNVAVTVNGSATTWSQLSFFTTAAEGGFLGGSLNLGGPQLFTGTTANPTFTLGTFSLCDCAFGIPNYTLTISNTAVPEPAAWAMVLFGFGAIGFWLRSARHQGVAAA
jgi:hypothetical protein